MNSDTNENIAPNKWPCELSNYEPIYNKAVELFDQLVDIGVEKEPLQASLLAEEAERTWRTLVDKTEAAIELTKYGCNPGESLADVLIIKAKALDQLKKPEQTLETLLEGERICKQIRYYSGLIDILMFKTNFMVARGKLAEALDVNNEAKKYCNELGDAVKVARTKVDLAVIGDFIRMAIDWK